jgi:hypothetical protein
VDMSNPNGCQCSSSANAPQIPEDIMPPRRLPHRNSLH